MLRQIILLVVLMAIGAYIGWNATFYSGLNAGVVIDLKPTSYTVGVEYRGAVGLFVGGEND